MGLSLANVHAQHQGFRVGGLDARLIRATFDSSYAAGGEALTAHACGLSEIFAVFVSPRTTADTNSPGVLNYFVTYNAGNSKLQLWNSAGDGDPFDEAGTDDASLLVVDLLVLGV